MMFKNSAGYTVHGTGSGICLFVTPKTNLAGYPTKHITIPIKGYSNFI